MVDLKFDAKQDIFKYGEEEESIRVRRLILLEELTILKLFSKCESKDFFLVEAKDLSLIHI